VLQRLYDVEYEQQPTFICHPERSEGPPPLGSFNMPRLAQHDNHLINRTKASITDLHSVTRCYTDCITRQ